MSTNQSTWEEADVERLVDPLEDIARSQRSMASSLTVLAWVVAIWGVLTLIGNVLAAFAVRTPGP